MNAWRVEQHDKFPNMDANSPLSALVGDGAEGWRYLSASDAAPTPGVNLKYLTLSDDSGPVGFAPCFATPYTWLPQRKGGKTWPRWLNRSGSVRLIGMGSPHANELGVRLEGGASTADRAEMFAALVDGFDQLGRAERAQMLLIKDVNARDAAVADPILRRAGYARMVAPPLAYLHLPVDSAEAYLAAFSHRKRADILRNVKKSAAVEVEAHATVSGMAGQLNALAAETRLRAGTQFGGLEGSSDGFFEALADKMPEQAIFTLFRVDADLIGFSLMLADDQQIFGKTMGLTYPQAREHKVYFRNLIEAIDLTARRGLDWLCLGQLAYGTKLHIGAKLEKRWYYVKVRGAFGADLGLVNPFIEGRQIESESGQYTAPDTYFADNPDGPQPPAKLMFG